MLILIKATLMIAAIIMTAMKSDAGTAVVILHLQARKCKNKSFSLRHNVCISIIIIIIIMIKADAKSRFNVYNNVDVIAAPLLSDVLLLHLSAVIAADEAV